MKSPEIMTKRFEIEQAYEYRKWVDKIPFLKFPKEWEIQIIPPFGGAIARFRVKRGDNREISIYLDCYDELGYMKQPYWEIYPYGNDAYRVLMNETDELIERIGEALDEKGSQ